MLPHFWTASEFNENDTSVAAAAVIVVVVVIINSMENIWTFWLHKLFRLWCKFHYKVDKFSLPFGLTYQKLNIEIVKFNVWKSKSFGQKSNAYLMKTRYFVLDFDVCFIHRQLFGIRIVFFRFSCTERRAVVRSKTIQGECEHIKNVKRKKSISLCEWIIIVCSDGLHKPERSGWVFGGSFKHL